MKIVADRDIPHAAHYCSGFGDLELIDGRAIDRRCLRDADALLVRTATPVNEALLGGTAVRFVASVTSGTDHVDLAWLRSQGISFASAPGCNARSVAEYVLSCLSVCAMQRGRDLHELRVGIVGCGHTGSALWRLLGACGIECLLHDPLLQFASGDPRFRPMRGLLDADVLSFHVPLTADGPHATRRMLDRGLLAQLKDDVVIINTARGGIVDEPALLEFLGGHPAVYAALDVWRDEPDFDPALAERVHIRTPHIAGYSLDGRLRATQAVAAALRDWLGSNDPLCDGSRPVLPVPDVIDLRGARSEPEAMQKAILDSYDVRADVADFDKLLALPWPLRARGYAELRNHYAGRREFTAHTVRLPSGHAALRRRLHGLGFILAAD